MSESTSGEPSVNLKRLPSGGSYRYELYDPNRFWVDKTYLIPKLIAQGRVILTRPKCFGKTVLLILIEELFRHGPDKLQGLAVAKLWHEEPCPVVRINLYSLYEPETCEANLCRALRAAFHDARLELIDLYVQDAPEQDNFATLSAHYEALMQNKPMVVLVDNWFKGLAHQIDDPAAFDANKRVLAQFFAWLKGLTNVKFMLVTACGFHEDDELPLTDGLRDISMDPEFAPLLGYTQAELESAYAPYIKVAAPRMGFTQSELLAQIQHRYYGFCFDREASCQLYEPFTINDFFRQFVNWLDQPYFRNRWRLLDRTLFDIIERYPQRFAFLELMSLQGVVVSANELKLFMHEGQVVGPTLLLQTGILSIRAALPPDAAGIPRYRLDYTNAPMAQMVNIVLCNFLLRKQPAARVSYSTDWGSLLTRAALQHNLPQLLLLCNYYLSHIEWERWYYPDHYAQLLSLLWRLDPERGAVRDLEPAAGRADFEVQSGTTLIAVELQVVANATSLAAPSAASEAASAAACKPRLSAAYYDQLLAQGYSLDAVGPNAGTKVSAWLGLVLVMAEETHQVCQVQVITSDSVSEVVTYQPDSDSELWSAYDLAQYAAWRARHS